MRSVGHLDIGPLRFALRTDRSAPVRYADPAYAGFFSTSEDFNIRHSTFDIEPSRGVVTAVSGGSPPGDLASSEAKVGWAETPVAPLLELPVDITEGVVETPSTPPLWRAGGHWGAWDDGADLNVHVGLQAPEEAQAWCRVAKDLSGAILRLPASTWRDGSCESPLRYPLDQMLSWGLLSRIGGALFHAAAVVKDGVGVVLAGRSGAGKSTLAALCHAQGWRILNDDRAMVFRRGAEWRVAGTPWHGSGRFAEAAEVPLGGLYFLAQSGVNRIEPLEPAQARLLALDTAAVPWFVEEWSQGILDGLDDLVRDIQPARLHFTKTPEAVETLAEGTVPA